MLKKYFYWLSGLMGKTIAYVTPIRYGLPENRNTLTEKNSVCKFFSKDSHYFILIK